MLKSKLPKEIRDSSFRRISLKGKEKYEWVVCERKETYVEGGNLECLK